MEYQHWIASSCEYVKSHNPRNAWQWIKKTAKIGKSVSISSHPFKGKNDNLVFATKEKLKVWHNHFKKTCIGSLWY